MMILFKTVSVMLVFCAGFCTAVFAGEKLYTMERNGEFRATFSRDFSRTSFQDGGVSGKCFKAILPEGGKVYAVHSHDRQKAENVKGLYISGFFKGKGRFRMGFILYGKDNKIFWLPAPGVYSPAKQINTEKWEKHSFTLLPPENHAKNITGFLTAVVLLPGTELFMDDIQTKIITNNKNTTAKTKEEEKK